VGSQKFTNQLQNGQRLQFRHKVSKELQVGQIAKRQAVINPENTFLSKTIYWFEGETSADSKQLPYKVGKDQNDNIKKVSGIK
jgi:molecular chaperone DnaK (HSP70)